jgi:hypothetical protein
LLARAHRFPVITVDGPIAVEGIAGEVERALVGSLPSEPTRVDLRQVRRWEIDVAADNIARWLATSDVPVQAELTFPFNCERGQASCAALSDLTLDQYRAITRVLARGHPPRERRSGS